MSTNLVSVIIPVYKVEKQLDRCLNSVVNQTYSELEIILIDDGSPDRCPSICDEWAKKDSRIKVIHKKNGGLSDARNVGIESARGDYIAFVDSDDWIASNMIEKMMLVFSMYDVQMVSCQYENVFADGQHVKSAEQELEMAIYDFRQALELLIQGEILTDHAWRKVYKRKIFETIRFPVGKNYEDIDVAYQLILQCDSVVLLNDALYYYFQNENGILGSNTLKTNMDYLSIFEKRSKYLKSNYSDLEKFIEVSDAKMYVGLWVNLTRIDVKDSVSRDLIKSTKRYARKNLNVRVFRGRENKYYLKGILIKYIPIVYTIFIKLKVKYLKK